MAGYERESGVAYVKELFSGGIPLPAAAVDYTETLTVTAEILHTSHLQDELGLVIPVTEEEATLKDPVIPAQPKRPYSPYGDEPLTAAKPIITPGESRLLPGVTNYMLVTHPDGTKEIRDFDRDKYEILSQLGKRKPVGSASAKILQVTQPQHAAETSNDIEVAVQKEAIPKIPKQKKTFSENWNTLKRNTSRTARVARAAGVLAIAGLTLSGAYKVGGGPSVFEDGLLRAPKNVVLDLQMTVEHPLQTLRAQPLRLGGVLGKILG